MESISESSVDTVSTEAKAPRGKQRLGNGKGIDWGTVKRLWTSGMSVADIVSATGVKRGSIYSHAERFNWPTREEVRASVATIAPDKVRLPDVALKHADELIKQTVALHAPAVNETVRKRLDEWFQKVLSTVSSLQRQIDAHAERRCEVEEIKSLSSSLEVVDRIARRTFGLDSPSGSAPVSVFSVSSPAIACPIIDIDTLPEATPATAAESKL